MLNGLIKPKHIKMDNDNSENYISTTEARKIVDVTPTTLRRWDQAGTVKTIRNNAGQRRYNKQDLLSLSHIKETVDEKRKIIYARVSSRGQKEDLERQIEFLKHYFPTHELVTDIGSGINFKKKGIRSILERASKGELSEVVVAHRDRLSRLAFDLIEHVLAINKVQLVVLDKGNYESPEQDLEDDIISFIHVYSCKQMGRRRYSKSNDSIVSYQATNDNIQKVDG